MKNPKFDKTVYYNSLQEKRKEAKRVAEDIDTMTQEDIKKVQAVIPTMSATGYMFCKTQMDSL